LMARSMHAGKALCCAVLIVPLLSSCLAAAEPRPSEREPVLARLEALFGAPLDSELPLYAVNGNYALQPRFSKGGELISLKIGPRYWWREKHPEWEESDDYEYLSTETFRLLLGRLRSVKDFGDLKSRHASMFVTNLRAPHRDWYEQAAVDWGEIVDIRYADSNPPNGQVKYFSVLYLREHVARPSRVLCHPKNEYGSCLVWVGDRQYELPMSVGKRLREKKRARFLAVGPTACKEETGGALTLQDEECSD
jgi:hypothetical protein